MCSDLGFIIALLFVHASVYVDLDSECLSLMLHAYCIPHLCCSCQLLHLYEKCFRDGRENLGFHHRLMLVIIIPPLLSILNFCLLVFSEWTACRNGGDVRRGSRSPLDVSHDTMAGCQSRQGLAFPCDPVGSILHKFRYCIRFACTGQRHWFAGAHNLLQLIALVMISVSESFTHTCISSYLIMICDTE